MAATIHALALRDDAPAAVRLESDLRRHETGAIVALERSQEMARAEGIGSRRRGARVTRLTRAAFACARAMNQRAALEAEFKALLATCPVSARGERTEYALADPWLEVLESDRRGFAKLRGLFT